MSISKCGQRREGSKVESSLLSAVYVLASKIEET